MILVQCGLGGFEQVIHQNFIIIKMSCLFRQLKYLFPWWSNKVSPGLDLLFLGDLLVTLLGILLVGAREPVPRVGHLANLPGILLVGAGQHRYRCRF